MVIYNPVPIPFYPYGDAASESPPCGGHLNARVSKRTEIPAERPTSRLVPLVSITSRTPSTIAQDALFDMESLPYNHPLQKYQDLSKQFCEYLDLCEKKGFVVHGYDYAKGEIHNHFLEYENRWSPGRRKELSEKLDRLEYWFALQMDRPVTMITLTSYHEGMSIQGQWNELSKSRGKLLKLLAFYFDSPDYFWVVEPHKKGYVHFHLAVFADVSNNVKDKYGEGIEDKFRRLWSKKYKTGNHTYGLDFKQKKGDEKLRSLKNYLSKYLQKGFLLNKWTPAMLVFNACLWDTGFRLYGASKNVSHIMNIQDEKQNDIVWLETKIKDVKRDVQQDGTPFEYDEERVVWYRQYVPEWLDSPFWSERVHYHYECDPLVLASYEWLGDDESLIFDWCHLEIGKDPDETYIYDWGRSIRDPGKGYDPTYGLVTHVDSLGLHGDSSKYYDYVNGVREPK